MVDSEGHGPRLFEYLDRIRGEQTMRQFCIERGLDDARVSAWKNGSTPRIEHLRQTADALGVTLGRVLVIAGFATEADMTITPPAPPNVDAALAPGDAGDQSVEEKHREILRAVLEGLRAGGDGTARVVVPRRKR